MDELAHRPKQTLVVILVRIHALYDRNLRLLVSVLGISLPLLAFIFWSFLGEGSKSDPVLGLPGCHTSLPKSASFRAFSALVSPYSTANEFLDLAAAWEALFLYDTMMFGLTVFKTYSTWRWTDSESNNLPIHRLILRDGVYLPFPTKFYVDYTSQRSPNLSGSLSTFASCMSVTLMARLMLNLYNAADAGNGELADFDSHCGVKLYFAGTQPIWTLTLHFSKRELTIRSRVFRNGGRCTPRRRRVMFRP
ncbi:hypothetical protein B0H14DRAFT_3891050 [Mycena olivaceomarginata]|nr:hypothetical protein B0H14DRAFT_3891050 [Mycena olivaceomarginata]